MKKSRIRPPSHEPAIRVVMMPRDANANQTIFGGVILSYIDQAGFVECKRQAPHRYVTIAMDQVEFHKPVYIGDIVSFYCETTRIGRTSITVHVKVTAERPHVEQDEQVVLTEADITYVAIDEHHVNIPIFSE